MVYFTKKIEMKSDPFTGFIVDAVSVIPVDTWRRFNVDTTSYNAQKNVKLERGRTVE